MDQMTFADFFCEITHDYILCSLNRGTGFENGKKRVREYFKRETERKKRADFLKDEYGIGGYGFRDDDGVRHWLHYDGQGIKIMRNNDEVLLRWEKVAVLIDELINEGVYVGND